MSRSSTIRFLPLLAAVAGVVTLAACSAAGGGDGTATGDTATQMASIERGKYLVEFGGCHECHTPKVFGPNGPMPDSTRLLAGHLPSETVPPIPSGLLGPGKWAALASPSATAWGGPWGISYSANLTPHETGMKAWTVDQFIQTMKTGKHLGTGRQILPPMPWYELARLTDADQRAIFAYLQSIPPVDNQVPAPTPPSGAAPRGG